MITGSHVPFYAGKKILFLAPVSLAEWETYELLKEKDSVKYMIQCSLKRANQNFYCRWFFWRYRAYLQAIVEIICKISLPPNIKEDKKVTDKEIVNDIKTLFRNMSKMYGWTPDIIKDLSPSQLYDYMIGGKDGTGTQRMSVSEYASFRDNRDG